MMILVILAMVVLLWGRAESYVSNAAERRYKFSAEPLRIQAKIQTARSGRVRNKACTGTVYLGKASKPPRVTPYDQGDLQTCQPSVLAMAMRLSFMKISGGADLDVSRMFLYYILRRACIKTRDASDCIGGKPTNISRRLNRFGFLPESEWPYNGNVDESDPYTQRPPNKGWAKTARQYANTYLGANGWVVLQLTTLEQIQDQIDQGYPVLISYMTYEGMHDDNGAIRLDHSGKRTGGHAVLVIGYDDCTQTLSFLNSWGREWGKNGIGTIPYAFWQDTRYKNYDGYVFRFTDGRKLI